MNTEIFRLEAELNEANADLALFERLKEAKTRIEKLSRAYENAAEAAAAVEAERAETERASRFDGLGNLSVTDITEARANGGILQRQFRVSWTAPAYDYASQQTVQQPHSVVGLHCVPEIILWFLIERHPDMVPAGIKELCPDDLPRAFREYFTSRKRGYARGPVSV